MTVREVAEALAVSVATVQRLIQSGALPVVRPRPTIVRVRREDLDAYVEAHRG